MSAAARPLPPLESARRSLLGVALWVVPATALQFLITTVIELGDGQLSPHAAFRFVALLALGAGAWGFRRRVAIAGALLFLLVLVLATSAAASYGPLAGNGAYLLLACFVAAAFLPWRWALVASGFAIAAFAAVGVARVAGLLGAPDGDLADFSRPGPWVRTGTALALTVGVVLALSLAVQRLLHRAIQGALEAESRELEQVRRHERETTLANRALRVLLECNEALVRARSEVELLRELCRSVVETGGFAYAWVGDVRDDPDRSILTAASWGPHDDYAAGLRLTWADAERGRGPAGTAVRERRMVLFRDHATEERFAPWREKAAAHGFVGSIALPLVGPDRCFGVLAFYASERDAFDGPVVPLLQQLADDLAYGIGALRDRNALAASREELRGLAGRIDEAREEEKARLARDLHDDMGQLLTAAKMDLRYLERKLADLPPDAAAGALLDRTLEATELVDQAVSSVRRIAAELRPLALDQLGLPAALRQEGRRFEERTGIATAVDAPDLPGELPTAVATALYRIAQEALTNVARHARAGAVRVALAVEGGRARLEIRDDGCGLPGPGARGRGMGLLGMRERAERLGGEVSVEAAAKGTRVTAVLPLGAAEATP
ncbi:MAG: GAF domain-containing sensor histidine kinase [Anaeromyxobacteraceae bacterium]